MTYTLDALEQEQRDLRIDRFDYDFVWRLGSLMRENAASKAQPVSITISHGADVVFSVLLPGATPDNLDWAARKRAVANRFHRSSLSIRLEAEHDGYDFNKRFRLPEADYVASGGGVPLILSNGTLIGAAGVSGLPDVDDHLLVVRALKSLLHPGRRSAS